MDVRSLGEFGLIAQLQRTLASRPGLRYGIGDDAAVLESLRMPLVTCDALVENVHFKRAWTSARSLGRKCMAVNVSDIAAAGGRPVAAFVSLCVEPETSLEFVEELYAGMEEAAARYGFSIAGGDTARTSGPMVLSVTLVGEALDAQPLLRSGAAVGDVVLVTGSLGDSAAGLALLQSDLPRDRYPFLIQRHFEPEARLPEVVCALKVPCARDLPALRASIDLSDGLIGDAAHIAQRSQVRIELDTTRLPLSTQCLQAAQALGADAKQWALQGGEDYELFWCVAADAAEAVCSAVLGSTGTTVTPIGRVVAGEAGVELIPKNNERAATGGAFTHF